MTESKPVRKFSIVIPDRFSSQGFAFQRGVVDCKTINAHLWFDSKRQILMCLRNDSLQRSPYRKMTRNKEFHRVLIHRMEIRREDAWLQTYIDFLLTPGKHRDTYVMSENITVISSRTRPG